jgi:hypothetical protein
MPKFHVLRQNCDRYQVEADNEEAAVKIIHDAYYAGNLKQQHQPVDFFNRFTGEGEVEEEEE